MNTVVRLSSLSFQYENGTQILDHLDFAVEKGDFLGLIGPNGSGKSTLMKLILGLLPPKEGTVELFGTPVQKFKDWSKIGYVAQQAAHGAGGFPATVKEIVASGLVGKLGLFRRLQPHHHAKVQEAVERVGLGEKLNVRISNLSGGQLQRVFIARALVAEPELLILDEPTVGVDQESIEQFYGLLQSLKEEKGMTVMMVNHDIGVMTQWVGKVACLQRSIHFYGSAEEFNQNQERILASMYSGALKQLAHQHKDRCKGRKKEGRNQ